MPANVETKILEPGKTAYVFIDAFDHGQMETDREILLPFYDKVGARPPPRRSEKKPSP